MLFRRWKSLEDLSNTLWAYGTLKHKRNEHMRAINWEVMRQIEWFSPQGRASRLVVEHSPGCREVGRSNRMFLTIEGPFLHIWVTMLNHLCRFMKFLSNAGGHDDVLVTLVML